jgi:hypothetical protein
MTIAKNYREVEEVKEVKYLALRIRLGGKNSFCFPEHFGCLRGFGGSNQERRSIPGSAKCGWRLAREWSVAK